MATIKSYADLEQSRKLAEIIPLESADTIWDLTNPYLPIIRAIPYEDSDYNNKYLNIIPCWSLAALLEAMPNGCLIKNINGKYKVLSNSSCVINDVFNNSVDACVAMIEKLHELKML